MLNRRKFLKYISLGLITIGWKKTVIAIAPQSQEITHLSFLITGNMNIEKTNQNIPSNLNAQNWLSLSNYLQKAKKENLNFILFSMGGYLNNDIFVSSHQASFEIEAMNHLGYQVAGLTNSDWELGFEKLGQQLALSKFTSVCSNYNFNHAQLKELVKKNAVIKKDNLKIGVISLNPDPAIFLPEKELSLIEYLNPLVETNNQAQVLKSKENCDFVICLVNNCFKSEENYEFAKNTEQVDLIIFNSRKASKPFTVFNKQKHGILVYNFENKMQQILKMDFIFSDKKNFLSSNAQTVEIGK